MDTLKLDLAFPFDRMEASEALVIAEHCVKLGEQLPLAAPVLEPIAASMTELAALIRSCATEANTYTLEVEGVADDAVKAAAGLLLSLAPALGDPRALWASVCVHALGAALIDECTRRAAELETVH